MTWRAGVTARLDCSLCQAGTYLTGSGQGTKDTVHTLPCVRCVLARPRQPSSVCLAVTSKPVVALMVLRAGATAAVDCSLCQAGTYGTGSGPYHAAFLCPLEEILIHDMACRCHCTSRLQPVSSRDVLDGIRSGRKGHCASRILCL
jgi:hypothetical protein